MKKVCLLIGPLVLAPAFAETFSLQDNANLLMNKNSIFESSSHGKLTVQFQLKELNTEKKKFVPFNEQMDVIKIDELESMKQEGAPALPYYSKLVYGDSDSIKISIEKGEARTFNLTPSAASLQPCRCAKDQSPQFYIDQSAYENELPLVEVSDVGDYRGRKVSKIIIRSSQYSSEDGLKVYPNLKVNLFGDVEEFSMDSMLNNKSMIMVAPDKLMDSAKVFAKWKSDSGFSVSLFSLEKIGAEASDLETFFKSKYKAEKFQYALLFGHEDLLPSHYVQTSSSSQTPSDLPNFLMGGEADVIPDVQYGRIVADTNEEVLRQLEKTQEYVNESWGSQKGRLNHIGIASNEGWDPNDEEYVQAMIKPLIKAKSHVGKYFYQKNSNSTVSNINKVLNEGAIFLNYIGHGVGDSWPSIASGEYHSRDIAEIKSGVVKPVIIDVACQNGRFSYEGRLGERFMNETNNGKAVGAVAYFGGSVDISWDPPAIMAIGINEFVAKNTGASLYSAILAGQLHLLGQYDDRPAAEENFRWYHLFGDPSLPLK